MVRKLSIFCSLLLISVLPYTVFAGPVPDTGQTKCYDDVGNEINPCPQPGEDFYGQDANYAPCNIYQPVRWNHGAGQCDRAYMGSKNR